MEKEIEKLKQEYINTPIPKSLEQSGFSDVLSRISMPGIKPPRFYYSQIIGLMVLVILLFTSFVGFAQASRPGTPLYPIKQLTASVLSKVTGKTPKNVEKEINQLLDIKNPTPTTILKTQNVPEKTVQPQDTEKKGVKKINIEEKRGGNEIKSKIEIKIDEPKVEVKGLSTTKENDISKNIPNHVQEKEKKD